MAREEKAISPFAASRGFGYSDHFSTSPGSPVQPSCFVAASAAMGSSYDSASEIFNFASGINLIGFPKNSPHHLSGPGHRDGDVWTHHHHHHQQNELMVPPSLMVDGETAGDGVDVEDLSLRCSVFPCGRNERPSQGLSLSLSSTNPSRIGLQSFELRHAVDPNHHPQGAVFDDQQGGLSFGKSIQPQQMAIEQFDLRSSKHLIPTQELLNEFCSLGSNDGNAAWHRSDVVPKQKGQKGNKTSEYDENRNGSSSSSSKQQQSLQLLKLVELQKRKTKLVAMLNEVDGRHRHYCNQMKTVVSSFEAVAGDGAATVYSALASKAMSRHFRCLRDGIVGQIQLTNKAMGEKDSAAAPGTTKGETPRLRIIDQALRQQRAFQQMSMMENHPWRPQRGLPEKSVSVLRAWLFEHFLHPYPSDVDKHILSRQTGLSRSQVSNWFINARVRLWKPMVEEMYLEETKEHENEHDNLLFDRAVSAIDIDENSRPDARSHLLLHHTEDDQKPSSDQLVCIDSECLSSIISGPDPKAKVGIGSRNPNPGQHHPHHHHLMQHHNNQWTTELDFSLYDQNTAAIPYESGGTNFGGVSLTLGLQQHHGGSHHRGVSLAFSSAAAAVAQGSLFYPREQIEDCHPGDQYSSILDGEGQNLPYRDLMGAQLLHDLAG